MVKREIRKKLEELLLRNDSHVNLVSWSDCIDTAIRHSGDRDLIQIAGINITEAELNTIKAAEGVTRQKTLFTLLCLAKYYDLAFSRTEHWVNLEINQILKMANVTVTGARRGLLIRDLAGAGLISKSKRIDSTSIQVHFIYNDSKTEMVVSDFRNLGFQYMNHVRGGYIECAECGLMVKRSGTRQKYCNKCAKLVHAANTLQKYYERTA